MLAVALALGCSACYGVSNFVGPQLVRRHTLVSVVVLSQVAALLGCALYLGWERGPALSTAGVLLGALAGVGNAVALIAFYKAAQLGPLSVAAPIGANGAVIPAVWGVASGDSLHALQVVGLVLAIAGAALAARREFAPEPQLAEAYADPRASAFWALLSAVALGIFLTALPAASEGGHAWALLDSRVVVLIVVAIWAGRRLATVRSSWNVPVLAVPGLLLVAGTLMYIAAADVGQLSLVSVLGSLFPVVTVGLGMAVLGERLSRAQAVGVTATLAGIVLIAS